MKKTSSVAVGLVLIIPGIMLLLRNLEIFDFFQYINLDMTEFIGRFWPIVFMIVPGIIFHLIFVPKVKESSVMVILAGILVVFGIVTQISYSYNLWHKMWPGYILAFAIGLYEVYILGNKSKVILIFTTVFTGVSALLFSKTFFDMYNKEVIIPLIFIATGLIIIFGNKTQKRSI